MAQLYTCLHTALQGERQIVFVTGEAGIGKTTLVKAFLEQLGGRNDLRLAHGQCFEQYGAGEAYLPVLEALGHLCRLPGQAAVVEVLGRYAPTWLMQMPSCLSEAELKALRWKVQGATKERMLREMAEALEALTMEQALVLWFDDLHWSDYATLDLVSYLARRTPRARLLLLGVYRPVDVLVTEHPLQQVKQDLLVHGQCTELSLAGLTEAEVGAYVAARFASGSQPAVPLHALAKLIYQRTEGNPLFMVNMVDYVVVQHGLAWRNGQWVMAEAGTEMAVPLNIRQFIEQQVARLSPEMQQILTAASVAGVEFSTAAVAAALAVDSASVEQRCAELMQRGQFLCPSGVSTWPDGTVAARYSFCHALYQEVLYYRLTMQQRLGLHRRLGRRLEAAYGARAKEIAAELAGHCMQGRDFSRAVRYLHQAGENAIRRSAPREAITHLRQALELLPTLPESPERARQELQMQLLLGTQLSTAQGFASPEAARAYARARALCDQSGEDSQRFMALGGLFTFYRHRAELHTAYTLAEQLQRLAQRARTEVFSVWADLCLGMVLHDMGDLIAARTCLEQGVTRYDPHTQRSPAVQDPGVLLLSQLAQVLWLLGYPEQALQRSQRALTLARQGGHPLSLAQALQSAARVHHARGELYAVGELAEELIVLAEAQGFAAHVAAGAMLQGWALSTQGQPRAGVARMRCGLDTAQAAGTTLNRPYMLALLAEAYGNAGDVTTGLGMLAEALALVDSHGERWYAAELYRLKGMLSLPRSLAEARRCFQQALSIARQQCARSLELRAALHWHRLWPDTGGEEYEQPRLAEIYTWFTEGFNTSDLQEVKGLLEAGQER
jgi:predicted ATPase/type II secretory pathway predicted ATPase ExeA